MKTPTLKWEDTTHVPEDYAFWQDAYIGDRCVGSVKKHNQTKAWTATSELPQRNPPGAAKESGPFTSMSLAVAAVEKWWSEFFKDIMQ